MPAGFKLLDTTCLGMPFSLLARGSVGIGELRADYLAKSS